MVIRLTGVVVVVRLIGPGSYGLYSAAAAFVGFAARMAQMGAEIYLIRSTGAQDRRRYDEVFTLLLCTAAVVTAGGIGLTYLVGPWLRPVGVVLPLRVLLLAVPLNILWAPAQARIERQLAFRQMGLLELGGDVALYGTAVPLAVLGAGLWSLVAGYFAWQAWLLVGSFVLSRLRPRLAWSRGTARAMLRHGSTYSLSTWLAAAQRSATAMIVGTFAGAAGVGIVTFAQRLVTTLNFTTRGVHRVGIAAISRAGRPERDRLSRALEEGSVLLMLAAAAPFAVFGLVARWVVPWVFGSAWAPALPVYVLLSMAAVLAVPMSVHRTVLLAYGRNLQVAVACAMNLVVVATASVLLLPSIGLVGFGVASLMGLSVTFYTHHAAVRYAAVRYRRLVVPVAALLPPALVPLVPLHWDPLLLLPAVVLAALPSTRRELWALVDAVRSILPGRAAGTDPATPAPTRVPARTTSPTCAPVGAVPDPLVPPYVGGVPAGEVTQGRPSASEPGGDEVRLNGSFAPGMLRLSGRGGAQGDPEGTAGEPPAPAEVTNGAVAHGEPAPAEPATGEAPIDAVLDEAASAAAASDAAASAPAAPPAPVVSEEVAPTPAAPEEPVPAPAVAEAPAGGAVDPVSALLESGSVAGGQVPLGTLLARTGRLMGAQADSGLALLVAAFDVGGPSTDGRPGAAPLGAAIEALRAELRFDDPVARVGDRVLVVTAPLVPGASDGPATVAHLAGAVDRALGATNGSAPGEDGAVRHAHVVAEAPFGEDVDELVRQVVRVALADDHDPEAPALAAARG